MSGYRIHASCRDVSWNNACRVCNNGCELLVSLDLYCPHDRFSTCAWAEGAKQAPRAHRTPCLTNTWCSDRIFLGFWCSLDKGGGFTSSSSGHECPPTFSPFPRPFFGNNYLLVDVGHLKPLHRRGFCCGELRSQPGPKVSDHQCSKNFTYPTSRSHAPWPHNWARIGGGWARTPQSHVSLWTDLALVEESSCPRQAS